MMAILLIANASAEITLFNSIGIDNSSRIVDDHAYYYLLDTSVQSEGGGVPIINAGRTLLSWIGIGTAKAVPITLRANIESLPFALTYGVVDWCNFSTRHERNIYDIYGYGNYVNTSIEEASVYITSGSNTSSIIVNMYEQDVLTADVKCHYNDTRDIIYYTNLLVGRFDTFIPTFECGKCEKYSLEQLSNKVETADATTADELSSYTIIQKIVDYNFQVWLILSWIIKFVFIIVGLFLIFSGVYYFYKFLTDLGNAI
jgi:hypothetical protein